jgi:hypothetical protein
MVRYYDSPHNEIEINYQPDERGRFGYDNLTIKISGASHGAIRCLINDIRKSAEKAKINNDEVWHPVTEWYADLCKKIYESLNEKINNVRQS